MGNLAFWGIALPLCTAATLLEWEYCATDSAATMILTTAALQSAISPLAEKLGIRIVPVEQAARATLRPTSDSQS
jgi:hypothetical protein